VPVLIVAEGQNEGVTGLVEISLRQKKGKTERYEILAHHPSRITVLNDTKNCVMLV
jgi:hypothetical protein